MYQRRIVLALLLVLFLGAPAWAGEMVSFGPVVVPNGVHGEAEFGPTVDPVGVYGQMKFGPMSDPRGTYGPVEFGPLAVPNGFDLETFELEYGPIVDPHGMTVAEAREGLGMPGTGFVLTFDPNG